jgi:hypothetical protein
MKPTSVEPRTVDLSAYPDLVVIYLGMRVRLLPGLKTILGLGPQIDKSGAAHPEGLLHYENNIIFGLFPLHIGMRWYWRDFDSMERYSRSAPHKTWWRDFMRDSGGTGFWHEVYRLRGGMEGVYVDMNEPAVGFQRFAPSEPAHGAKASARQRLALGGESPPAPEALSSAGERRNSHRRE